MNTINQNKYDAGEYWSRIFVKNVDAKSVCYPEWPLTYNQFLHEQQARKLMEIFQKHQINPEGKSILEIGPGSGFWTHFFSSNKVSQYTGIDISSAVVENLRNGYPSFDFYNNDIGIIDPALKTIPSADLIFSAMVLLHITDDDRIDQAFSFFSDKLNANGHFILLDAIAEHQVFGGMKQQAEGPEFSDRFHNKIRKMKTISALAAKYNLEVVDVIPAFNSSQMCFDFKTYFGYLIWGKLFYALHRRLLHHASEGFGNKYAAFQSKLDHFLTDTLGLSMSSKWIVFRKIK